MLLWVLLAVVLLGSWAATWSTVSWGLQDLARIPRSVWFWSGYSKATWELGMLGGFVLFGAPGLLCTHLWRRSGQRAELLEELAWQRGQEQSGPDGDAADGRRDATGTEGPGREQPSPD